MGERPERRVNATGGARPSTALRRRSAFRTLLAAGNTIALLAVALLLGAALGAAARTALAPLLGANAGSGESAQMNGQGRKIAYWKSSMIPNFVSPHPGKDPMGMDLVPVYEDQLGEQSLVAVDPHTMRNMGLRTTTVNAGTGDRVIRTLGRVDYAEPLLGDVTLQIGGWIEQLFVDYSGQRVRKGERLLSVYSPELVTAQQEYLESMRSGSLRMPGGEIIPAREKLRYWDVPESEIARLKRQEKPIKNVTFVSPFDGWVVEKHVYDGMYVKPGARLYRIADLSTVWVYVTVYQYQLPFVEEGLPARMTLPYAPGKTFSGKVIYVYPEVSRQTRQTLVRLEFSNDDLVLKPQMYGDVDLLVPAARRHPIVPLDAVIYTGRRRQVDGVSRPSGYAYVMVSPGKFQPREVILGDEIEGGRLEVLQGLEAGEEVVVCGQFLLHSEWQIKQANLQMLTKPHKSSENAGAPGGRDRRSEASRKEDYDRQDH
jgi:multidrug efflux pump subunit AcrA (membrane-fusion protein)